MLKRKPLLFLTVAFAMVVLFATTAAIAQDSAPTIVKCEKFTITLQSVADGTSTYAITAKPSKELAKVNRVVVAQSTRDCIKNPIDPGCDLGVGDTATKWGVGLHEVATNYVSPVAGNVGEKTFNLTAQTSLLGGVDMIIDTGSGIVTCASQVAGFGDADELPVEECRTEVIPQDPFPCLDKDGNPTTCIPEDCIVETCYSPTFSRNVVSGDCVIPDEYPMPVGDVFPGLIVMEEKTNLKKSQSPDEQCQYYFGMLICTTPCCPAPYSCPPYPGC